MLADSKRVIPSKIATAMAKTNRLRPVSNATINRELEYLRQAYTLRSSEIGCGPSMPKLKERVREGFYDRADFELIVTNLPEDLQDFA